MSEYLRGLDGRLRAAGLRRPGTDGHLERRRHRRGRRRRGADPLTRLRAGDGAVAGRHFAEREAGADTAVVADTGGTSYDVSLVRRGRIPWTRETWLGEQFSGHMTGFPSVDVRAVGAGGGSIAWVDDGGLLHVGPQSAGAEPGPVCYGRGGDAADRDRRRARARLHRSRLLPRRARCGSTPTARRAALGDAGRRAARTRRSKRPLRRHARRDRAHGRRHRGDHTPPGDRSAQRRARRRRRRGRPQRGCDRATARLPAADRDPAVGPALSAPPAR